jgi:hypothetical protein
MFKNKIKKYYLTQALPIPVWYCGLCSVKNNLVFFFFFFGKKCEHVEPGGVWAGQGRAGQGRGGTLSR